MLQLVPASLDTNHRPDDRKRNEGMAQSPVEIMRRYIESSPQEPTCREELSTFRFWKAVRSEFLATLLLIVMGCGACMKWKLPPSTDATQNILIEIKVTFAFGFAVATLVQCVGQVSGAHMNPAVTVALMVTRHITLVRTIAYIAAQCLGSLAGSVILYGLTPTADRSSAGLGVTEPSEGVDASQAFGMEFLASVVIVMTVLSNMDPKRTDMGFRALSIGMSYIVGHFLAFPYTGASFNPARSLGPAIVTNCWNYHWVYWVAPILGGIIGGFTYDYTQESSHSPQPLRRSFRSKLEKEIKRDHSGISNNDTEQTQISFDYRA